MARARFQGSWTHDDVNEGDGDERAIEVSVGDKAVMLDSGPWNLWLDATTAAALSAALFAASEESISDG